MKKIVDWLKKLLGMSSDDNSASGFTLIELLVVIGILGVLAAVLLVLIDPLDKIRSANDAGVVSTTAQLGRANDTYAANNANLYASANTFAGAVTALNTAGETKYSSVTAPTGYTFNFLAPANCSTTPANCTTYVFYVNLLSKKYTATPYYQYANGKGCFVAAAPAASTATCP